MLWPAFNKPQWPGHCQSECNDDAGPSCDYPRNCGRGGHQYFFGTFHFDRRFGHEERGGEISRTWFRLFLTKKQTSVVHQAPYSPDMAPCDFWLFPKLKRPLKGKQLQTIEDIMTAMTAELNTIPKETFSECLQQWRHWWEKCVESQGDYVKGD